MSVHTVARIKLKDSDLTNNSERPPAPRQLCPKKYLKKVKSKDKKVEDHRDGLHQVARDVTPRSAEAS